MHDTSCQGEDIIIYQGKHSSIPTQDCNLAGPEVCRTEYISECWTKNEPHIVEDDVPSCRTEYKEKCVETQVIGIVNTRHSSNHNSLQSGYVTKQDCSKWPREVCTVKKKLRAKFNPVTKCEKVTNSDQS